MTTPFDLIFLALFAVAWPLLDRTVLWPAFLRRSRVAATQARLWIWATTLCEQWVLVIIGIALWLLTRRDWASLGLSVAEGWRLWGAIALVLLLAGFYALAIVKAARSPSERANVRSQAANLVSLLPHSRPELYCFVGLSLTAGLCEEFLFRGYFIWALAPWLGWWGAAALSVVFFALGHSYQGLSGMIRTGIVGALLALVVAVFGSLFPAMALHAIMDIGSGVLAWLALREGQLPGAQPGGEALQHT